MTAKTVLIVDDEAPIREMIAVALEMANDLARAGQFFAADPATRTFAARFVPSSVVV